MRIYIPAVIADLGEPSISSRVAHAVTPALQKEFPDDEDELLEAVAMNAAADDSLRRISLRLAESMNDVPLRCVVVAEMADFVLDVPPLEALPTAVQLRAAVPWEQVESIHVDDLDAESDVAAAAHGDEAAFERTADDELMWYDVAERRDLWNAYGGGQRLDTSSRCE